jgi:hypothetical protein
LLEIPLLYIKDKQVFSKTDGVMRLIGKPLDVAKELKKKYKLIHFVDSEAMAGMSNNLDIYNGLTYFVNIQVECAPKQELVTKLLALKCRVVLDVSAEEKIELKNLNTNLLVARIPSGYTGKAEHFRDVILLEYDERVAKKFTELGKRIILYENENQKKSKPWGIILSRV